jgi:hypothetical protein
LLRRREKMQKRVMVMMMMTLSCLNQSHADGGIWRRRKKEKGGGLLVGGGKVETVHIWYRRSMVTKRIYIYILYIYLKAMMGKPKRSLLKKDVEAGLMEFSRDCVWF